MVSESVFSCGAVLNIPGSDDDPLVPGHGADDSGRVLGFRPDFIEHQLAHAIRDPNGRAYNRTAFLSERRRMMQVWADDLDRLQAGNEVTETRRVSESPRSISDVVGPS